MAYNKVKALLANVQAIQTAREVLTNKTTPTAEQIQKLKGFSGFGGIKEVLYLDEFIKCTARATVKDLPQPMFDALDKLGDELRTVACKLLRVPTADLADSVKNSVLTAFYTPTPVIEAVGDAVKHTLNVFGIRAQSMIETSAGIGGFLPVAEAGCKKVAFEKDKITSLILQALNPDVQVFAQPFETIGGCGLQKFDIAASNIPFGDIPVHDDEFVGGDEAHRAAVRRLHTYFFVKTMEQLENGGILAFVTSRGVADSDGNRIVREWMVANGNLLAAVRLPDNLFMDGSGVEVGSDLIIFQRDQHKKYRTLAEEMFLTSANPVIGGVQCGTVNRLLSLRRSALYTEMRVERNQFGEMLPVYYWKAEPERLQQELTSRLCADMEVAFRKSAWMFGHDTLRKMFDAIQTRLADKSNDKRAVAAALADAKIEKMRPCYEHLLKCYSTLMQSERRNRKADPLARYNLNEAYDKMIGEFGTLHSLAKIAAKRLPDYQLALSLENRLPNGTVTKSDVFTKPIAFRTLDSTECLPPIEALAVSMNERGKVDVDYIEQLTGQLWQDCYNELKNDVFLCTTNPTPLAENGQPNIEWQHKSVVINGDVIARRKAVEQAIDLLQSTLTEFKQSCLKYTAEALKGATPVPIPYEDIDIQLGARWVPIEIYKQFIREYFGTDWVGVVYLPANDMFSCDFWGSTDAFYDTRYGSHSAAEIFGWALQDNCPSFTKDGKKDVETARAVQKRIDKCRAAFAKWIHGKTITGEWKEKLATIYNERFNCLVRHKFDGSLQTFPDLDFSQLGFDDLYQSQKDAIWMIKQNSGGVCWHEVGGGKTMIMCVAAYEMHRLALVNKPLIIGMKANVQQIADTFRKAYPSAKVLYPTENDFSTANRNALFRRIANNDWDCIILSHDQFNRIPQAEEVQIELLKEEQEDLRRTILFAVDNEIDRRTLSRLEKSKARLTVEINTLQSKIASRSADTMTFHQMGIDHIFVDEYHNYKNLRFNTRHSRVAGLGNSAGSEKSFNLLTAIRDIQQQQGRDMCASFFSGTIISNALTELFVLFKYLMPRRLAENGMTCFDAWAANFTQKSVDYDLTVTGEIKAKERFRTYTNVPELSAMLHEITDYRTAEMINLDRPKANVIFDCQDPTTDQSVMLGRLCKYAMTGHWSDLELIDVPQPKNSDKALMLIATDIARKVSLDPRMLSTVQFSDDANNKASRCARKIYEYYRKYDEHKGTQFVFCDISTYDKERWNIYEDIKSKLVSDYGLPAEEIAFIHQYDTDLKREKLFTAMNDGSVRVLFGSTQKLGTGVNAQQRAVAVHHLDIPWRPSDLDQRTGRAVRKGNEVKIWGNNTVDVIIYGTNRTLDAYKFSLLKNKAMFINQMGLQDIGTRKIDEDQMDEDNGMNFAEYVALLSGNEDLLKKAKLDNKIAALESDREKFIRDKAASKAELAEAREKLVGLQNARTRFETDLSDIRKALADNSTLNIYGAADQSPVEQAKQIRKVRSEHKNDNGLGTEIGLLGTMPIVLYTHFDSKGVYQFSEVTIKAPASNMHYRCNERGTLGHTDDEIIGHFNGLVENIERMLSNNEASQQHYEDIIKQRQFDIDREWDGDAELADLLAEREELISKVDAELDAKAAEKAEALDSESE